jgi:hypothetical protein
MILFNNICNNIKKDYKKALNIKKKFDIIYKETMDILTNKNKYIYNYNKECKHYIKFNNIKEFNKKIKNINSKTTFSLSGQGYNYDKHNYITQINCMKNLLNLYNNFNLFRLIVDNNFGFKCYIPPFELETKFSKKNNKYHHNNVYIFDFNYSLITGYSTKTKQLCHKIIICYNNNYKNKSGKIIFNIFFDNNDLNYNKLTIEQLNKFIRFNPHLDK